MEEVVFTNFPSSGTIDTPIGVTNVSQGTLSYNHVTSIWDGFKTKRNPEKKELKEEGEAEYFQEKKLFSLIDHKKQTDYHLVKGKSTGRRNKKPHRSFKVLNSEHLSIVINSKKSEVIALPNQHSSIEAQLQYLMDIDIEQENKIAKAIRTLNCETQKLEYAQATSTAQYNPWLAENHLKMPQCTRLHAQGSTITIINCQALNVTFETIFTKCGPQLKYEELTLNTDGWELIHL